MGKLNEIQEEVKQSFGSNSFTTTIKEDTVEFDSAKDSFTFLDPVNVPAINVNGEPLTPAEPQVQVDWNQNDSTQVDYIKNRICYDTLQVITYANTVINEEGGITTNIEGGSPQCYYFNEPEGAPLFVEGGTYPIQIGNVSTTFTLTKSGVLMGNFSIPLGSGTVAQNSNPNIPYKWMVACSCYAGEYAGKSLKIEQTSGEIKKIDDKYIDDKYLAQSDWNQNDSTQVDYIKNRICYDNNIYLTAQTTSGSASIYTNDFLPIELGKTYIVEVDGTTYTSTPATNIDGAINAHWNLPGTRTIELIYLSSGFPAAPNREKYWFRVNTSPEYDGKVIRAVAEQSVGIADKYIPQLGGVKFKIESGALKASVDGGTTWGTITLS